MRDDLISILIWTVFFDEALCDLAVIVHVVHVLLKCIGSALYTFVNRLLQGRL